MRWFRSANVFFSENLFSAKTLKTIHEPESPMWHPVDLPTGLIAGFGPFLDDIAHFETCKWSVYLRDCFKPYPNEL
jgi:hypothetical protein